MERSGPGFLDKGYVKELEKSCEVPIWEYVWPVADCLVLVAGVPANVALLRLILGEKKSLSPAKVLGLNLAVMDFFFMSLLPFGLIFHGGHEAGRNESASSGRPEPSGPSDRLQDARDVFDMFSLVGCPLLLACMCVERYLAVLRPVLYLRLRRWDHRAAVCAAVWAVTFAFVGASAKWQNPSVMNMAVSVVISCLFVVMLACLGTIMRSLRRRGPAGGPESPPKRRAVRNVLAVVVPAVGAYLPVLVMFLVVLYFYVASLETDRVLCSLFEGSRLSPKVGVLIGPLFYLSRAKQLCCLSGA